MFYLIIAALITSYYLFMAPKSVRNTLGMIGLVGLVALLIVLAGLSFIKIMQTPKEIFVGLAMIVLGYYALRDIQKIPKKPRSKH
ncbi:DUF3165 family protein [Streptococcus equi]|uniref:DUF3165 family protein n=1 Tax=Streptococcus equi TaxID=1336 RepID=UPI002A54F464|nr:DUF3165 family protein [Streptococcus equi subsp. zooepidemicus]